MLRIICGQAGSGKTAAIFKQAATHEQAIILVPEQFSFAAEKRLLNVINITGISGVEVLNFTQLAGRVFAKNYMNTASYIDAVGKLVALYQITKGQKTKLLSKGRGVTIKVASLISELKRCGITPDMIDAAHTNNDTLQVKLQDVSKIYRAYNEFLEMNMADHDDDLHRLAPLLCKEDLPPIFIDQFASFTAGERRCIMEMLKCAPFVTVALTAPHLPPVSDTLATLEAMCGKEFFVRETMSSITSLPPDITHLREKYFDYALPPLDCPVNNVHIFCASDPFQEAYMVACHIVSLVMSGYRYADIALVTRAVEEYEKQLNAVFDMFSIPLFYDAKLILAEFPLAQAVMAAVEIIIAGYTYQSVFRLAKCGFLARFDQLENYVLEHGIKGKKWNEPCEGILEEQRQQLIFPVFHLHEQLLNLKTTEEKCRAVFEFAGQLEIVDEDLSAYQGLADALSALCTPVGEQSISIRDFYDLLWITLNNWEMGHIPQKSDACAFGEISRVRPENVKVLFVLGVNEGVFPKAVASESILSERERIEMESMSLSLDSDERVAIDMEQYLIYSTLCMPSDQIFVCYSQKRANQESMRPSAVVTRLLEMFTKLSVQSDFSKISLARPTYSALMPELSSLSPEWSQVYCWFENNGYREDLEGARRALGYVNKAEHVAFLDKMLYASVSRLEQYKRCPFSYFCKYVLKAKPRKVLSFSPPDAGSFLHNATFEFSQGLEVDGFTWRTITDEYIRQRCREIVSKNAPNNPVFDKIRARLCNILEKSIKMIVRHIHKGKFIPFGYEVKFSKDGRFEPIDITLPTGHKLLLEGIVDRVDMLEINEEKFVRIIDYKSGDKKFNLDEVRNGLELQLIVYITAIAKNTNSVPAGMLYFKLDQPMVEVVYEGMDPEAERKIEKCVDKAFKMKGVVLAEDAVVLAMDEEISGNSDVIPMSMGKSGVNKGKNGLSRQEWEELQQQAMEAIEKIATDMLQGKIDIAPAKRRVNLCAKQCDYGQICGRIEN